MSTFPMRLALPLLLLAGCVASPAVAPAVNPPSKPGRTTGNAALPSPTGHCAAEVCDGNSTSMAQTSLYDPGLLMVDANPPVVPFPSASQAERAPDDAAGDPEPLPPNTTAKGTLIADDVDRFTPELPAGQTGRVEYRFIAGMRSGLRFEVNPELGSATVHPGLTGSEYHMASVYFTPTERPVLRVKLAGRINVPIGDTLPVPYRLFYRIKPAEPPAPGPTPTPDPNATPTPGPNDQ